MKPLSRLFDRFFPPIELIKPGIYHLQAPTDSALPYRLHLRIESNGEGTLIVNASTVLHLNQTAAEFAYHIINHTPTGEIINQFSKRYQSSKDQFLQDYQAFLERIKTLVETPDLDPVTFLDFERTDPYSKSLSAPLRLDCALTYRITDTANQSAAPLERVRKELETSEWKNILDKAWKAGIPHIIFTGGEPTLRDDLVELIQHAEGLGQVTGLLTDGVKLAAPDYVNKLLQSGLDHLMIVLDIENDAIWDTLRMIIHEDIYTTVHLTISQANSKHAEEIMRCLSEIEVNSVSLSTSDSTLKDALKKAQQTANEMGISLKWDLPVPYSGLNPVSLELMEVDKSINGAGSAWLYIEPDGDILAGQGMTEVLGNMLADEWNTIWQNQMKS